MSWNILAQKTKAVKQKAARKARTTSDSKQPKSKLSAQYMAEQAAKGCDGCPLNEAKLQSPKMKPTGARPNDTLVYVLGEAPGREEDEQGEQFVGASGKLLRKEIPDDIEDHVRWNNVIRCRPPGNREPSALEVACCRKQQERDIERSEPKLIVGFGGVPLQWVTGESKIIPWRGRVFPVQVGSHACWYAASVHPAYVLYKRHQRNGGAVEEVFKADVHAAFDGLNKLPAPTVERLEDKNVGTALVTTLRGIEQALEEAGEWDYYGIDLETSAFRPYAKDARILTFSVSNYGKTFAMPLYHKGANLTSDQRQKVKGLLYHFLMKRNKPIAHNSKFEQEWLAYFFGSEVVHELEWQDTMSQAYTLDERTGALSLEAVSMLRLGVNVKLMSRPLNMGALDDEPLEDVLWYNSYDAKYVYPIFFLQQEMIESAGLSSVYKMQNDRVGPIALMQMVGIKPDTDVAAKLDKEYRAKIRNVEARIQKHKDVVAFIKDHGRFLPTSNKDLPELFYRRLGFKQCLVSDEDSDKEKLSTDENVLSKIDHPVARMVLELRGYTKQNGYVTPLLEGGKHIWPDGMVHTTFNSNRTSTGRLSCEDPNLQNYPMRTPEGRRIRQIYVAEKGKWLVAADYGQIEARVIAMASKCPVLTDALWTGYDIHGEWARRIALVYPSKIGGKRFIEDKAVMKKLRDEVKNGWTFPLFYGSVLDSVCEGLAVPKSKLAPLYDEFWNSFSAVKDWQDGLRKFYRQRGYVQAPTFRRRHAPLSWNEIINSGIQGAASDIVVDALIALSRLAYTLQRPQLQAVINVHDDLTYRVPDKTLEEDLQTITQEMTRPRYSWVTVPIVVEVKVGHNWGEMEEIARVSSEEFGHRR